MSDDDKQTRIRKRAYEIWEQEGQQEGRHMHHWDRASREIEEERSGLFQSSVDSDMGQRAAEVDQSGTVEAPFPDESGSTLSPAPVKTPRAKRTPSKRSL